MYIRTRLISIDTNNFEADSQQQQTLLKSLVEDRAAAGKTTLPQNRCHTSGKSSDHSSSEGFQPSPSKMSKPKVYLRVKVTKYN